MADKLSLGQQVDIALIKANKKQTELVEELKYEGVEINYTVFSTKKKYNAFDEREINAINKVLKSDIKLFGGRELDEWEQRFKKEMES